MLNFANVGVGTGNGTYCILTPTPQKRATSGTGPVGNVFQRCQQTLTLRMETSRLGECRLIVPNSLEVYNNLKFIWSFLFSTHYIRGFYSLK